ncbi:MAG TPA: hypothetical protein DGG94_01215 [Micromonosporaceae bacterium]|nr:hypothetical protein [Micromonosporaceae bacterium]HCU48448.1 hypothetical protein [Micromonosporaceae bacterium]
MVAFYPTRSAVPTELWKSLVTDAKHRIDVLVMAGLFLPEQQDVSTLAARAGGGLKVRLLLADPASDAVLLRGREEGFGLGLCHRVVLALRYYEHLTGLPGVELRLHGTTLYNSLFRSDDTLLVNAHLYGSPAGHNPVLHLHRVPGGQVVERYLTSFDKVWAGARACTDIDAVLSDFEKRIHGQA